MPRLLPLNETDFWWLRYFCGIFLPVGFTAYGIYSLITLHSYAIAISRYRSSSFVSVHGEQAILMGIAYLGIAVSLFADCYAQYHEKMGFWYQWILSPGATAAIVGMGWCTWLFVAG